MLSHPVFWCGWSCCAALWAIDLILDGKPLGYVSLPLNLLVIVYQVKRYRVRIAFVKSMREAMSHMEIRKS